MAGVTAPREIPANLTNRDCPHPPRGVTKAQFQVYVPLIAPEGGGGGVGGQWFQLTGAFILSLYLCKYM